VTNDGRWTTITSSPSYRLHCMPSHLIASSPARCRVVRPPGNLDRGQSFTIWLIVCFAAPHLQDGSDGILRQRARFAAHCPWPFLKTITDKHNSWKTEELDWSEETHYWEQFWKGKLKDEKQEETEDELCWMGSWQKETPNSASVNWNQQHTIKRNRGVITARTCQRTKEVSKMISHCNNANCWCFLILSRIICIYMAWRSIVSR